MSGPGAAGYSGTPLWKKLGLKPGMRAQLLHADPGWAVPVDDGPSKVDEKPGDPGSMGSLNHRLSNADGKRGNPALTAPPHDSPAKADGKPGHPDSTAPLHGSPTVDWLPAGSNEPAGMIVAFYREAAAYLAELDGLAARIHPAGMIWAAWPRKAAGHVSDLDENLIRDAALARGLVDVKVAALSADWSALKLVVRRTNR